ncbi:MAG: hypothetical protein Q7T42_03225 [Methylotenera sp.]|uniref:hypothetical protein n=1 Tax=Methylotenera sp. TaxID=2051956 RepID=UPI00271DD1C1|nr:hypothetical protein [Methylotenera sp.]MDO9392971.1 hypothetical protein [Methylotenera sp.]
MNKVTFKKTKDTDKANLWVAYQDGQLVDICISEICDFDLTNLRYRIYKRSEKLDEVYSLNSAKRILRNEILTKGELK